jgi:hypothetical protein
MKEDIDKKKLFDLIRKIENDLSQQRDAHNLIALRVTALEDKFTTHEVNDRKWWRTTIDQVLKDLDHVRQQVGLPTSGVVADDDDRAQRPTVEAGPRHC